MAFSAIERFTLVDVDGILLGSPTNELTIPEPIGFSEFIRNVERDSDYYGFTAEYGDAGADLSFDWNKSEGEPYSPHEFLQYFLLNIGSDSKVLLRYYRTTNGVESLDSEWSVLFDDDLVEDDALITTYVQKLDFNNKLRTRLESEIDVQSSVDLDDNANDPLSLITVPLHSKGIGGTSQSSISNILAADISASFLFNFAWGQSDDGIQSFWIPKTIEGNITEVEGYVAHFNHYQVASDLSFLGTQFPPDNSTVRLEAPNTVSNIPVYLPELEIYKSNKVKGVYGITSNCSFRIQYNWTAGSAASMSGTIYLEAAKASPNNNVQVFQLASQAISNSNPPDLTFANIILSGSKTDISLNPGDRLFLWVRFVVSSISGNDLSIRIVNINSFNITFTALTYNNPSTTTGHLIYNVLTKAIQKAISSTQQIIVKSKLISPRIQLTFSGGGGTFNPEEIVTQSSSGAKGFVYSWDLATKTLVVYSTYGTFTATTVTGPNGSYGGTVTVKQLNEGYASTNLITTGKKIRGVTTNANINVVIKKIMNFLKYRFGAGWMIQEINGVQYVVIERGAEFFNDVEVFQFPAVVNPVNRSIGADFLFNEFEYGYEKFAKENEKGSIKGFNTKRSGLFPVEMTKKKLSMIAQVVTDDIEIERVRRLDIDQDQSDQSDDELIVIKCQVFNSLNPVYLWKYSANTGSDHKIIIDDASDTIILDGFYLKGQIETATSLTFTVLYFFTLYTQTVTISSVSFDAKNNRTIIRTPNSITAPDSTYSGSSLNNFYFNKDIIIPERLENISTIGFSGLDDKFSAYNLDHTPTNFLISNWNIIGGAYALKEGSKKVKYLSGKNNTALTKRYLTTDGNFTSSQISENQDFLLSSLRLYNPPILKPFDWEFEAEMTYEDFANARLALLAQSENGDNLGYFTFPDNFGNLVRIYAKIMTRNEVSGMVKIIGWEKEVPSPETTNYLLREDGSRFTLEDGTGFILRET